MEQGFDTEVITSAEGFPTLWIVDTSSSHPTLHGVEHVYRFEYCSLIYVARSRRSDR